MSKLSNTVRPTRHDKWVLAVQVSIIRHGDNPRKWSRYIKRDFPNEYLEYLAKYDYINS